MRKQKEKKPNRLPKGKFLAWSGRGISVACSVIILGYLSFFCTETLGLSSALVGILFMVSKVFDGITDIFAGYIIDNTKTRFGRARPYEFCVILLWLCTWLLYSCPVSWGAAVKAVWVFIMYTLVYSVWSTFLNISEQPYTIRAWGSREMIVKVSSYNGIFVTFGAMVVSILFPVLMGKLATSSGGWSTLIGIYAIPLTVIGMMRFLFVKENPEFDEQHKTEAIKPKEIIAMLRKNPYAWYLGGMTGMVQIILGMSVATYYFKWIVGDIEKYSVLQAMSIVSLLCLIFFPMLMKKMSVANLVRLGACFGMIGYAINFFAGSNMGLLIAGFILSGLASMPISYMQAPMLMEVATYNEYKGMSRMDAASASAMNCINKICNGLGSALLGVFLSIAGYVSASSTQGTGALMMIRCLYSIVPFLLMIVIIFCATKFEKLSKMMPEIEKKLEAGKGE